MRFWRNSENLILFGGGRLPNQSVCEDAKRRRHVNRFQGCWRTKLLASVHSFETVTLRNGTYGTCMCRCVCVGVCGATLSLSRSLSRCCFFSEPQPDRKHRRTVRTYGTCHSALSLSLSLFLCLQYGVFVRMIF